MMDYSKAQEELIKHISDFLNTTPTLNSMDNLDALTGYFNQIEECRLKGGYSTYLPYKSQEELRYMIKYFIFQQRKSKL